MTDRTWITRLVMAKAVLDEWSASHTAQRKEAIGQMEPGDRLKAPGGMGELKDNGRREGLWLSPACIQAEQTSLFELGVES